MTHSYEAVRVPAADDGLVFGDESVDEHEGRSVTSYIVDLLRGCRVFHFHDTSIDAPVKRHVPTADSLALRDDAANLAAVLLTLRDE